ncbi:class II glutamine amidotransferase [Propionivibrio sp.]|uniref:class II glutamine amidotransferase n=1 Tax=Propionivibrio sp. TaxID=2212460 RepID=UPI003BF15EE1
MCQLLGMNSNKPTDLCFSFTGFKARGGVTDIHTDGWGIAFFEGRGARILHEPHPSSSSRLADQVCVQPVLSTNVIAHIRKATQGEVRLENTHPFTRELWGQQWVFAHNGNLENFAPDLKANFQPQGTTDSELAFCWLMQNLQEKFGAQQPDHARLFDCLRRLTMDLTRYGVVNFLLSNGECLFAHSSTRLSYLVRQAPFANAHLIDEDLSVDFGSSIDSATRTVVIATAPLTDNEPWVSMPAGSLWCFSDGEVVARSATVAGVNSADRENTGSAMRRFFSQLAPAMDSLAEPVPQLI